MRAVPPSAVPVTTLNLVLKVVLGSILLRHVVDLVGGGISEVGRAVVAVTVAPAAAPASAVHAVFLIRDTL